MFVDSGSTVHMVQDDSLMFNERGPSTTSIHTTGSASVRERSKVKCGVIYSSSRGTNNVSSAQHAPTGAQNWFWNLVFCDEGQTVIVKKANCVVEKKDEAIGVARRTGGLHAVVLMKSYCYKALFTSE